MSHYQEFESGVYVNTNSIHSNDKIEVTYEGLLAKSGAEEIYAHYGSSYLKDWAEIHDIKMTKKQDGTFSAQINVDEGNAFNVCFHDNAYNWDNNCGNNYSFRINQ